MGKKSTVEVTEKILEAMSSNSEQGLVIQDISKKADVSWDCTKRHLESFVKSKIVREYKKEGKPHYQMMCPIAKSDTLFSLPLSEEHRRTIKKIYATIKIVWKQITNKPLSKTLAQKIAVDVVEQKYKDIPRGWYLYGELLVLSFEAEEDYQETLTKKEEVDCVRAVCRDYLDYCDASYKIRRHQYEKKGNKLYLIKEDLMYCLGYSDFNDSAQKMKIRQLLNEFAVTIERTEENAIMLAIADDFVAETLAIFRHNNDEELRKARSTIMNVFEKIWILVATYEFYESLKANAFYDKEFLQEHFFDKFELLKDNALESLEELNDFKPKWDFPNDEITKKLKALMGTAKETAPEEKIKRNKEIEKIKQEKGEKGVDRFLSEKTGLNI